jgi:transposase
MNQHGTVSEIRSYPNSSTDALEFARLMLEKYGQCKAVLESTGNMWLKTYEALEEAGIEEVKLANPAKTRVIAEARVKTDKIDCRILAHLLRADLIASCYVPPKEVREVRYTLTHRMNIVRDRTRVENRIHSLLDKYDIHCEYVDMFGVHGMAWLRSVKLENTNDQEILSSLIRQIEFLNKEEECINSKIASDAIGNGYVTAIMSMTGFDYYGASVVAAYIGDINRFPSPRHLVSWVGICPSVYQSGESLHMGKMKDGNTKVRWILSQAANVAARCDSRMNAFYRRKLKRHHHNVAITHVSNKMLVIIWHMLKENSLYNERKEKLYRSKLKKMRRAVS